MRPPWWVRVQDGAALTVLVASAGATQLHAADRQWDLEPGDVALVRGPEPYSVQSPDPTPEPSAVIHPGQLCTTPEGTSLHQSMARGLRTWGNAPDGPDSLIIASYEDIGEVGRLVTDLLPPCVHLPAGTVDPDLLAWLARELDGDGYAQGVVLDRLVDIVLITALRAWIGERGAALPGWVHGGGDTAVGAALDAIHDHPEHPWTVASLADRALVSRTSLAARFSAAVGMSPIAYLSRWRLTVAGDLLADETLTLATVADRVGYGSPFALSAAFKKRYGVSPREFRRRSPTVIGDTRESRAH
ncbi:AraC-type DNA-binding protein [Rhodococcus triatomae]|uniref:AraC-type DNA-binding protein n=2 Tax=Rhodococcus triatomae TaxID=300028 RepID=A0A1G8GGH4_9NOCA|nr:AraC-type DNA-binding protein [Rhodococcus triatomae]